MKDPRFDVNNMTPAEIDRACERFDKSTREIQRRILVQVILNNCAMAEMLQRAAICVESSHLEAAILKCLQDYS